MDSDFHDWIATLVGDPEVEDEVKKPIIADLLEHRHVFIVKTQDFFPETENDTEYDDDDTPYSVISKAFPMMTIAHFEDLEDCVQFCGQLGMTYSLNLLYASRMCH